MGGGSKTGGNTEPMPFVRKWGAAAQGDETTQAPANPPETDVPKESRHRSRSRSHGKEDRRSRSRSRSREKHEKKRKRSRSREKKKKRSRSRSRSRSRERKRERKHRSRSRSRSRSRDRKKDKHRDKDKDKERERDKEEEKEKEYDKEKWQVALRDAPARSGPNPVCTLINPLVRADVAAIMLSDASGDLLGEKKQRKSRWSTSKSFVPGMPTILPSNLSDEQRSAYLLQLEVEDATRKLRLGDFAGNPDPAQRSPSPEPIYDSNGKRLNTREIRKRQELEQIRHEKIQALLLLNPNYKPPADYRLPNMRMHEKVWIPQDLHPEINFVGLLIGPRGNTLKALEMETGGKIIIRGKGSVKEGKFARREGPMPGENEPLHAYVTGADMNTIKRTCQRVQEVINDALAIPDGQNELRRLQLRELALLNGTLRPEDLVSGARCSNCGSEEHKTWECPDAPNVTANIICVACGGAGHIARDCKNPRPGFMEGGIDMGMDDEYSALMAELGEKPPPGSLLSQQMPSGPKKSGLAALQGPTPRQFTLPSGVPIMRAGAAGQGNGTTGGFSASSFPTGPYRGGNYPPSTTESQFFPTAAAGRGRATTFAPPPPPPPGPTQWWNTSGGYPMPVPPPPSMGLAFPPPPPPPPIPAASDLSSLLAPPAPPPPPPQ